MVGKSSFLNILISYLSLSNNSQYRGGPIPYQNIYTVGDGRRSTTEGVDVYNLKVRNKNLLIMDIEGDNDPARKETGVWIYTNLITTAIAVSHIHLYNYTGLPQQTFLSYFRSISTVLKSNKLHPDWDPRFFFLKKNHFMGAEEEIKEDLEEIEGYFQTVLSEIYSENCVHLFNTPPDHITNLKHHESCIKLHGVICEQCQEDMFFKNAQKLFGLIMETIELLPSYKNGFEVLETVEKILEINRRDLVFTPDLGHVSKIRLMRFRKEQMRINQELLEAEPPRVDKNLSRELQRIIADHPNLADTQVLKDFDRSLTSVMIRLAQLEYLIPEISRFVEECLLDKAYTVLDTEEKEILISTYCTPFVSVIEDLLKALKEYEKVADLIVSKLKEIKEDVKQSIKEYIQAANETKAKTTAVATNIVASGALGLVAREVGIRMLAGFLVGGGAIGAGLCILAFIKAKRKFDQAKKKNMEILNSKKIDGIENVKQAEEALEKVGEFIDGVIAEISEKNKILKEVCSQEVNTNYLLTDKIEEIINKKIAGEEITSDDNVVLIHFMKVAQGNLDKYKDAV